MSENPIAEATEPAVDPEVDLDWNSDEFGSMADYADNTEPETED